MCGITACLVPDGAVTPLLTGLRRLEYRGYDSAGIAVRDRGGIGVVKRVGEVAALVDAVETGTDGGRVRDGTIGIGHTRWATHGGVTDRNAHPHLDCAGEIAVVHNGIVDNDDALRRELAAAGHVLTSETDTEVIAHLIEAELALGSTPETAFRDAVARLDGSYAIAALIGDEAAIYATRMGSPLVFGPGDGEWFLASDVPAFIDFTDRVVYLHDGDFLVIRPDGYALTDTAGFRVDRAVETVDWDPETATKAGYDHFMAKEINEQPMSLRETVRGRIDTLDGRVDLPEFSDGAFAAVDAVHLVAMGTSYHAAMFASSLLLRHGVDARASAAGEYAALLPPLSPETLVVAVTQSGETADTLDAVRRAKSAGARTLAVTNVVGSSVTRECDDTLYLRAGPEIGVAATKTFSSQVTALTLLAERLVYDVTGRWSVDSEALLTAITRLPGQVQAVLDTSEAAAVAAALADSDAYFFIGRGLAHPVALEGALKFKEISYEHAEGFAASDLKHGPLALVTASTPVFAVFTGRGDEATLNNVKEVQARGAPVVAVTSARDGPIVDVADHVLSIPESHSDVAGVLGNVQLQLVAYHAASLLDRPIDRPRNLAKCVTVE
jgi:glucosamine--fructose-6-phosphate aminotransferase (isomerizing)